MARSPKTPSLKPSAVPLRPSPPPPSSSASAVPLKPILKETSLPAIGSMTIRPLPIVRPLGGEPVKKTDVRPLGGEPVKKQSVKKTEEEEDDEYYYNIFEDIVMNELPKVDCDSQKIKDNWKELYPMDHLQDDIVCVITEIYEDCGFLVIPDQELILKIAKAKIQDKKVQNEFIYGKDNDDSVQSIYTKIQEYTQAVRKSIWDDIANKYSDKNSNVPPGGEDDGK